MVYLDTNRLSLRSKHSLTKMSEYSDIILEAAMWLRSHLEIDTNVRVILLDDDHTSSTRGEAPWPNRCPEGELQVKLFLIPILNRSLDTFVDYDHLVSYGLVRQTIRVLSHEFVHVKQYFHSELNLDHPGGNHRLAKQIFWQGEVHIGPRGKTHKSYRNLPWEIEAFGREVNLMNGFFKRKSIINSLPAEHPKRKMAA